MKGVLALAIAAPMASATPSVALTDIDVSTPSWEPVAMAAPSAATPAPAAILITSAIHWIFFETRDATLSPSAQRELARLVGLYFLCPANGIRLTGHTDDVGSPADNLALSMRMVAVVRAYLEASGVAAAAIESRALGDARPLVVSPPGALETANRRVDLVFLRDGDIYGCA